MKIDAEAKARIAFGVLLVVGVIAAASWYALRFSGYTTYQIQTRDAVSGLVVDAPVEFHGVEVGKVRQIELQGPDSIRILIAVRDGVPITTDTVATITSRGLATRGFTGYVYVSLENDGTGGGPIARSGEAYAAIRAAPSRTVNLDVAIDEVNRNVQFMTQALGATLDPKTIAALKQSVDNLSRVSKMLDTQVLPGAQKSLARLDDLSTSIAGAAKKIERDPAAVVRGGPRRAPGPGEDKP